MIKVFKCFAPVTIWFLVSFVGMTVFDFAEQEAKVYANFILIMYLCG